ncbi:DUF948 domain-containing protein [Hippea maritima]|uniref:DUF948 domain-containing protein n=1 Tax=Hippea maritima (strain ATCC 700847 / DSM 10411 / MH2) TaxID=760142 RepID=F2LUF6_HIPMA|nr:DUF948 domain-containing protein [Hippea maritima]AEA33482.1 hypothetical protein Hipma_0511 [Hippea maritima DSM 10411]
MDLASVSLAVIALVYAGLALGGLIGIIVLIKLYSDMKKKVEEIKKQIEPYQSKADQMLYKAEVMMEIAQTLAEDVKVLVDKAKETGVDVMDKTRQTTTEVMDKAKETSFEVMDKTKETVDEVSELVVGTKKRVENHTNYIFNRVATIEEKLDDVYAFLVGIAKFTTKLVKKEDR